jgi:hypothetical protein
MDADDPPPTLAYIHIDYPPATEDPARIFRAMAALIDAFRYIDVEVARHLAPGWKPVIVLERIEAGSLLTVLRTLLQRIDDDALKSLDWKPLLGQFLVRFKYHLLRWIENKEKIGAPSELRELGRDLEQRLEEDFSTVAVPIRIPAESLAEFLRRVSEATRELQGAEQVRYGTGDQETIVNTRFRFSAADAARLKAPSARVDETPLPARPKARTPAPVRPRRVSRRVRAVGFAVMGLGVVWLALKVIGSLVLTTPSP